MQTGAISLEGGGVLGRGDAPVERTLGKGPRGLERDDDVKAVVLRIDSPGGSALASDLLWHELMQIRAKKPLVVSIGDMAASGGYLLSRVGGVRRFRRRRQHRRIHRHVVGGKIAAARALRKDRRVTPRRSLANRATLLCESRRAAYESLLRPVGRRDASSRPRDDDGHLRSAFLLGSPKGGTSPLERVEVSAEGRIFSGREGKARGLVDRIGGFCGKR